MAGIRDRYPDASPPEQRFRLALVMLGPELAREHSTLSAPALARARGSPAYGLVPQAECADDRRRGIARAGMA
jgi:hypothetical protein